MQQVQGLYGTRIIKHTSVCTLTVREVKVMHMPPKPLKVRAMKIRTESSAKKPKQLYINIYKSQNPYSAPNVTVQKRHLFI